MSAGPLAWVAYELEGECFAPAPPVSTVTLRLEARKRIAAARLHLAAGFRALNDARRRLADMDQFSGADSSFLGVRDQPQSSAGAICPEAVSSGSPGSFFKRLPVVSHDRNHGDDRCNIPPVKMGENP
jgi:hypothetical protein